MRSPPCRAPWNAAVRELFAESDFAFGILPAHAFASTALVRSPWEEHAFGSGPFRVTEWRRGDRVMMCAPQNLTPEPGRLESIYRCMMLGLGDYVRKNRFPGVILGLLLFSRSDSARFRAATLWLLVVSGLAMIF